jgi:cation diffusion facilitator CzcD-associated flavoprotein CzcO
MPSIKIYDVIAIGAGVGGIYQIKQLQDHGFESILLEGNEDLGGTWFKNRYPGCRFDSESYTYGYSFSRELVDEWHWKERFSAQPENLRYLNYVADKFDLRRHMRFNARVESMVWDESERLWTIRLQDGETFVSRFVVTCLGVLSVPSMPEIAGMDSFEGPSFHTFDWPAEPLDLENSRVGIIGTGATGIQVIAELADKVAELNVFQRHPNWSVPLNNGPITAEEMADIRARYDEILALCEKSQGGFEHMPDRRGYDAVSEEERTALWDELYDRPGFALLLANFPETFLEDGANEALSNYVASRIRQRVHDPEVAEKLIPRDHGFGMKRLPLESNYFEAYNRDNVHLVDLTETPIEAITPKGIQTSDHRYDLDVIVYATGFHAITGAMNEIDIRGVDGQSLNEKWQDDTSTYLGLLSNGFPNMLMIAGPQSVSGSTNYPRAIETGVEWATRLLLQTRTSGITRFEARKEAEEEWVATVAQLQERMPSARCGAGSPVTRRTTRVSPGTMLSGAAPRSTGSTCAR